MRESEFATNTLWNFKGVIRINTTGTITSNTAAQPSLASSSGGLGITIGKKLVEQTGQKPE